MVLQHCLVLIKPDGIVKSLTGNIISCLSETKLKIIGAKMVSVNKELAEAHYSELLEGLIKKFGEEKGKITFAEVLRYIQGEYHTNRVMVLAYEGEDAISKIRNLAGSTNPEDADVTTIRGKYGRINSKTNVFENVVHVSDSEASAKREIQIWFEPMDLTNTIYPTRSENSCKDRLVWDNN